MCSKPVKKALTQAALVINPVGYLANAGLYGAGKGGYEASKAGGDVGDILKGAGAGAYKAGISDPYYTATGNAPPADPEIPTTSDSGGDQPTPTFTPPNPSETASLRRRRRLNALRQGIASTIRTSSQGATDSANLLTPTAQGSTTGLKKTLGT